MSEAIEALKEGFYCVTPIHCYQDLKPDDLNLLICGNPVVNLKDWKDNTVYNGEYSSHHKVIVWLWQIICAFSQNMHRDLLQYVTGNSRVPIDGFSKLKTLRGDPALFTIVSVEFTKGALPRAHTCFNRLDLPMYPTKVLLKESIEYVLMNHLLGFGID